jgi:hypothetical protein
MKKLIFTKERSSYADLDYLKRILRQLLTPHLVHIQLRSIFFNCWMLRLHNHQPLAMGLFYPSSHSRVLRIDSSVARRAV